MSQEIGARGEQPTVPSSNQNNSIRNTGNRNSWGFRNAERRSRLIKPSPPPTNSSVSSQSFYFTSITQMETIDSDSDDNEEIINSVFTDFELLNDAIQDFFLDSDEDDYNYCSDATLFHSVKPFLNCSRTPSHNNNNNNNNNNNINSNNRSKDRRSKRVRGRKSSPVLTPTHRSHSGSLSIPGLLIAEVMLPITSNRRRHSPTSSSSPSSSPLITSSCSTKNSAHCGLLPRDRGLPGAPLCVVVDLDETLVAARRGRVYPRPHVKEFLDTCHAEGCEIVVWSAGAASHVRDIVRVLAAASQRPAWCHHVISRRHRWLSTSDDNNNNNNNRNSNSESESGVKDLAALGRPLGRVLLLENSPRSIQRQPQHCVLLEDYVHPTSNDDSLRLLAGVVRRLVAGLRAAGGDAAAPPPDVPRLLSTDAALVTLALPATSTNAAIHSRGLLYSPQATFSSRSYGGEHPLSIQDTGGNITSGI